MGDPTAPVTRREVLCNRWLGDRYCPEPMHPIDGRHEDHAAAPPAAPSEDAAWEALADELYMPGGTERGVIARHRPCIEAAIRAAHFAADPNTPAADCHNLTHRALDDARDELRAIRAAAGDGGLREAAVAVVEAWAQPIDTYTRPTQDIGSALTLHMGPKVRALRAALAHTESGLDVERERVLECARRVVSMLFYVNVTNPEMRDLIEAQGALSAAKRRPAVYAAHEPSDD